MGAAAGQATEGAALRLHAPISGAVIERNLAQGQVAEAGQTLFRIGDLSRLWLVAHAPERDAVRVRAAVHRPRGHPGAAGAGGQRPGLLVGSQVEVGSRTIPVRLEVAEPRAAC